MVFLTPILVLSSIALLLGVLLVLADRFLADYGECKITITGEKEFTVRGGETLLSSLMANGFHVPSSCAGKASCGYCKVKVLHGGGILLPTEKGFVTKEEISQNIRLACQVKVKSDMEIFMPDFLETVRNIVANNLYDPKLRWRFNLDSAKKIKPLKKRKIEKTATEDALKLQKILDETPHTESSMVPLLQKIDTTFNYLPEHALHQVAESLNTPLSVVYRVATFYNSFSLKPRGKNKIKVCLGTACYVKGGGKILQAIENELGIKVDNCTEDMLFSLESVNCLGCCGQSPVISINEDIYGYLKPDMMQDILGKYRHEEINA